MEGYSRNDEVHPQLLDFISKEKKWLVKRDEELELRLGPPGGPRNNSIEITESIHSLRYISTMAPKTIEDGWIINKNGNQSQKFSSAENQNQVTPSANTAVPNSSHKRTAPPPVVGWPPIRSFRKNLASSSSSKPVPETENAVQNKVASEKQVESCRKGLFVKINMDGVPIGRKVDLKAYDSYEKLSSAVDKLFRGLLAAQMCSSAIGIQNKQEEERSITGILDGSGEYTLVYEDNEGDWMLVGDVPWDMFVSMVKRLRMLKSSELPTLFLSSKQEKNPLGAQK